MGTGDSHVDRAIALTTAHEGRQLELAHTGLEALLDGDPPSPAGRRLWEAIVHEHERPAVNVLGDQLQAAPWPWTDKLAAKPELWKRACQAVGRLALDPTSPTRPYLGTGVMVGRELMLTNRHVAEAFVLGRGQERLWLYPDLVVQADLRQEIVDLPMFGPVLLQVRGVVLVHPHWDLAVLRVEGFPDDRTPVSLRRSEPGADFVGQDVMVIGFPFRDTRNDLALQQRIFTTFGHKRAQPGTLRARVAEVPSYSHVVEALAHDCSTLGGNSGSPVFDLATGDVIGLHFAGAYLEDNWAVPSWQLARDPRLVDLGLFEEAAAGTPAPDDPWAGAWAEADAAIPEGESLAGSGRPALDAALFERLDDDGLRERLAQAPAATRADLVALLGPEEAEELLDDLALAGPDTETIDPDKPELVYLHGILGGHLRGAQRRVWCAPLAFLAGDMDHRLSLDEDGRTGALGDLLTPDGHLRLAYARAARRWRRRRFAVHEWSFDWRRPVEDSAQRLHLALERLALDRPGRDFVLVAHSMGGLVAMVYATLEGSRWKDRLQRVVLLGSPLGGSFAPLEAGLGTYPLLQKLAWVTAGANADDLGSMSRTLPGLIDMLPHPKLFPDAAALYEEATWKGLAPLDRWLTHSEDLKDRIWESPLLARTRALATVTLGTVDGYLQTPEALEAGPRTGAGDGTVPARCAVHPDVPTWEVFAEHAALPGDRTVLDAVTRMAVDEEPELDRLHTSTLPTQAAGTETLPLETIDEAHREALADRLATGRWTHADARWLLSTAPLPVPVVPGSGPSARLPTEPTVARPGASWQARVRPGGGLDAAGLDPERRAAALSLAEGVPAEAWPRWTVVLTPTQGAPMSRVKVTWRIQEANPSWRLVVDLGGVGLDWIAPTPPIGAPTGPGEVFELLLPAGVAPSEHAVLVIPGPDPGSLPTEEGLWQTVQRKLRWRRRVRTFTAENHESWRTARPASSAASRTATSRPAPSRPCIRRSAGRPSGPRPPAFAWCTSAPAPSSATPTTPQPQGTPSWPWNATTATQPSTRSKRACLARAGSPMPESPKAPRATPSSLATTSSTASPTSIAKAGCGRSATLLWTSPVKCSSEPTSRPAPRCSGGSAAGPASTAGGAAPGRSW